MDAAAFAPQLARPGQFPPDGAQWLHEIKWDGYRILATLTAGKVRLWSRNGLEWTDKTPEIADAIQSLGLRSAQIDGELIAGRGTDQADLPGHPRDQARRLGRLPRRNGSPVTADRGPAAVDHPLPERSGKAVLFPETPHGRP